MPLIFRSAFAQLKKKDLREVDSEKLRSRLRHLLLECLMLLEFPEEERGCEVSLHLGSKIDVHITDLIRIISGELMNRIHQLSETTENKTV